MINQILIMKNSGITIFSWTPTENDDSSDLTSGFLTAINMFAQQQKGEQIKKIALDATTFMFERFDDNILVALTEDNAYESILTLIIAEIKSRFLVKFVDQLDKFDGNLHRFESFSEDIEQVLDLYGYWDYLALIKTFPNHSELLAGVFIEITRGEILYLKSRDYLDRDMLGFQTLILVKTAQRLLHDILHETPFEILLFTQKHLGLVIKFTAKILYIQQVELALDLSKLSTPLKPKRIQKQMKNVGKLLFDVDTPVAICERNGRGLLANHGSQTLDKNEIASDLITFLENSQNIVKSILKDDLILTLALTDKSVYASFYIGDLLTLQQTFSGDTAPYLEAVRLTQFCDTSEQGCAFNEYLRELAPLLEKAAHFRSLFE